MSYLIKPLDSEPLVLNEKNLVNSVIQNISIILSTRKGSVPMDRNFGLTMDFVDKPIPIARNMMVMEITEAVREYEPRARIKDITFETGATDPGRLIPIVEVEINEQ